MIIYQIILDCLIAIGFGLVHSVLATIKIKSKANSYFKIDANNWRTVETYANIFYIVIATAIWQPINIIVWHFSGAVEFLFFIILVFNWLWYWQIHLFEYDCGLAFGSTAFLLKKYNIKLVNKMWSNGSRKGIRFPVHTAFIFMFTFFPYMRLDMLILAVVLNIYNVIGSILYDKRLIQFGGEDYLNYIKNTNLILPKVKISNYENPYLYSEHFKNKKIYLSNLIIGLIMGLLLFFIIKTNDYNFYTSLSVLLFSTVFGVLSGSLTSIHYLQSKGFNFLEPKFHTILATKVGVTAAITVITWAALTWFYSGETPIVSLFFVVWFNMLWVGHICCGYILEKKINLGECKQC